MDTSKIETLNSLYGFVPNTHICIFAVVIFSVLTLVQLAQGVYYRQWWFAMTWVSGLLLQAIGYGARLGSITHPEQFPIFGAQISLLTLSPAFFVAGIQYQLGKLVTVYGQEFSQLRPKTYTYLLIAANLSAIIFQAIGAGLALSGPFTNLAYIGRGIVVAGLGIQIFSMLAFMILFTIFIFRVYLSSPTNYELDWFEVRQRPLFDLLIPSLMTSMVLLLVRSVYRLKDISRDWNETIAHSERYKLLSDGFLVLLACALLTAVHPGACLGRQDIPIDPPREKSRDSD